MKKMLLKIMGRLSRRSWLIFLLLFSCVCASGIRLHFMFSAPATEAVQEEPCIALKSKQEPNKVEEQKPLALNCSSDPVVQKGAPKPIKVSQKDGLVVQGHPADEIVPQPYRTTVETTIVNRDQGQASTVPLATGNSQQGTSPSPVESDTSRGYSYPSYGNYPQNYTNKSDGSNIPAEQSSTTPERSRSRSFIVDKERDRSGLDDLNSFQKNHQHESKQISNNADCKAPMTEESIQRLHCEFNKQQSQQAVQRCKESATAFLQRMVG